MGKRPKSGKQIDSPIISDGFGDIGHCQYGWTMGGTNACFRRPVPGTEWCHVHGAEQAPKSPEEAWEADALSIEACEEEHCYAVAGDIVDTVHALYESEESSESDARRFVADLLKAERWKVYQCGVEDARAALQAEAGAPHGRDP